VTRTTDGTSRRDAIRRELRELGLRATVARVAVLEVLREAKTPLTHADVAEQLDVVGCDRATVFRNLVALAEAGLVNRTDLGDHTWRFEAVDRDQPDHEHPHFLCTSCGTVACIPGLEVRIPRGRRVPKAVKTRSVQVQIKGVCDDCS